MKKAVVFALTGIMAVSMFGCGSKKQVEVSSVDDLKDLTIGHTETAAPAEPGIRPQSRCPASTPGRSAPDRSTRWRNNRNNIHHNGTLLFYFQNKKSQSAAPKAAL